MDRTGVPQDKLELALRTIAIGKRLIRGDYPHWAVSGGLDECSHGFADGIPCRKCDEMDWEEYNIHLALTK